MGLVVEKSKYFIVEWNCSFWG